MKKYLLIIATFMTAFSAIAEMPKDGNYDSLMPSKCSFHIEATSDKSFVVALIDNQRSGKKCNNAGELIYFGEYSPGWFGGDRSDWDASMTLNVLPDGNFTFEERNFHGNVSLQRYETKYLKR